MLAMICLLSNRNIKSDVYLLESRKSEKYQTSDEIQIQIDRSEKMLEWLETSCQEEEANIDKLEQEQIRLRRLVKRFKDNNEEYLKIKSIVRQQVISILFDGKRLLRLSLSSLMESMRTDPYRYSKLIYYKGSPSARNNIDWQYTGYTHIYGQQSYPSFHDFYEEYESTLLENAQKLYNNSAKEWTEQIIKEYSIKNNSSHDKLYRPDNDRQKHYKPSNGLSLPIARSIHLREWNVYL
jgi:hypothetical protein